LGFVLKILGSNAAVPAFNRNQTAQILNANGKNYLIDCGEATQLRLKRMGVRINKIDHIFISHLHGDHYFGLIGFTLTYLICVPLGVAKAVKNGSTFDFTTSAIVFMGYAVPGWAFGGLMLTLLGGGSFWDVFPLGGFRSEDFEYLTFPEQVWDQFYHTVLPVSAYLVNSFATLTILTKNSVIENLSQDYVKTAFAKGLSEKRVILGHVFRNSLIPLATGLGHALSLILAGSILIEVVFNINGMGLLGYKSILNRDYPVTMGILVVSSLLMLTGNIISDILYAIIDPRIRFK